MTDLAMQYNSVYGVFFAKMLISTVQSHEHQNFFYYTSYDFS